jgi:hypothetical protein
MRVSFAILNLNTSRSTGPNINHAASEISEKLTEQLFALKIKK